MGTLKGDPQPTVTLALDKLTLRISAPNIATLSQVTTFWCESFFLEKVQETPATATVQIDFHEPGTFQPEVPGVQPIYRAPDVTVWGCTTGFLLHCGASWLQLDRAQSRAWGVLSPDFGHMRPQDQRDFVLLTLLMVGHRHGYYGLHANGLTNGHYAYLLIGPSGSGKSTLAVQLIEQGWGHTGDDVVLLHADNNPGAGVKALALRRDFALSAQTLAHCALPLAAASTHAAPLPGDKTVIAGDCLGPMRSCRQIQPDQLLFATLVDQAQSRLEPLAQTQALVRLAQQSAGLLSDRTVAQAQMQLLATLCRQTQAYQLWLGRDVLHDPAQVAALL